MRVITTIFKLHIHHIFQNQVFIRTKTRTIKSVLMMLPNVFFISEVKMPGKTHVEMHVLKIQIALQSLACGMTTIWTGLANLQRGVSVAALNWKIFITSQQRSRR